MVRTGWQALGRAFWCCVLLALAGCAAQQSGLHGKRHAVGRAQVALPAGEWTDLGSADEAWAPLPAQVHWRSRALLLRGAQQAPLALVLVRTNASNLLWQRAHWQHACPRELDVFRRDEAAGSPHRMDCLRLRPHAQAQQWLQRRTPEIDAWLQRHWQPRSMPVSYLGYRFATEDGGLIELQMVVDQRLLQARAGDRSARPQRWALEVAHAARDSLASLDGRLVLPDFPRMVP